ncbi:MAG: SDR family oxidoreductase [Pseudomonadales bacterium]|jgi:NAD(P)-dependent dehydrogenase (short-subunit alcohol dehydrogenase family)|nr:SDR family oxidoreductase [Pseudomonadales bacterium]
MSLLSKVALVTGAGSGIGKACAIALARAGWRTVFVGRRVALLQAAIAEAGVEEGAAVALGCDVSRAAEVDALFAQVKQRFGRLDLLFNNAGMLGPAGTIDAISLEGWHQTLAVNLEGAFLCARAAFALMKAQQPQGGRIINNGSISAQVPRPQTVPYTVTKHAINGLTQCLALDGREYGIACGQIDIGNVRTDMTAPMTTGRLQANGEHKAEPVFELQELVGALLYMASLPPAANVLNMTVMATTMPFVGRG